MSTLLITNGNPNSLPASTTLILAASAPVAPPAHLHSSESTFFYTVEEIRFRAETVTPLLRELVEFRPPEHWGINE